MKAVFLLLGGFLAVSLALWNGCLGNRGRADTEVSVAQPRGRSEALDDRAAPDTSIRVTLRSLVESARHPDLRSPAFPEFRSELERMYVRSEWQPLWLLGSRPTAAAKRLIARLATADKLGLEPSDYDAEWLAREARELVAQTRTPAPHEPARFDVGLSVAAVRYVSALHRARTIQRVAHAEPVISRASPDVAMAVDSLRDPGVRASSPGRLQPRLGHLP